MANYFNPYSYQNYLPIQQQMQPVQQQQPPTIQQGGVVNVQSEKEARDYLVAQGTSVILINLPESALYVKTKGFSPMDAPTFDIYDLIKRNGQEEKPAIKESDYIRKAEFNELKEAFENFKREQTKKAVETDE